MRGAWLVGPMQAGEQVGQRRMVLPVGDQAAQQIGAAEKRAVGRRRSANDDVVAAAGTGVPAVEHELLGAESGFVRVLVEPGGDLDQLRHEVAG